MVQYLLLLVNSDEHLCFLSHLFILCHPSGWWIKRKESWMKMVNICHDIIMSFLTSNKFQSLKSYGFLFTRFRWTSLASQIRSAVDIVTPMCHGCVPVCFFQTPTLIVFGALDTTLGAQSHKNLINIPNHSVLKLEGAHHTCYLDKPREFHQHLIDFLGSLEWSLCW